MVNDNFITNILLPLPFNEGFTYFIKPEYDPKIGANLQK